MIEQEKSTQITIVNAPNIGDASPVPTLLFTTVCFIFWGLTRGYFSDGAELAIGTIQIGCYLAYLIGGIMLLIKGDILSGNIYMLFATFFAGIPGISNIISAFAANAGIAFDSRPSSIVSIVAGLWLLVLVYPMLRGPKLPLLSTIFGGSGTLIFGLTGFGILPASFNVLGGWILFACGCVGFYSVIVTFAGWLGFKLPS